MNQNSNYHINSQQWIKTIFIACICIEIILVIFDLVFNYLDVLDELYIRRIWNVAREQSIPTWFASTQTQLLGVTVLVCGFVQQKQIPSWQFFSWLFFGLFFLWVGIDDAAEIHEKLGTAIDNKFGQNIESDALITQSYSWQLYIAPIFSIIGLFLVAFFGKLFYEQGLFWYLFFGLGCWVVSQMLDFTEGLEQIETVYADIGTMINASDDYLVPHTSKLIEEYLEMLGTTLLWVGYLKYLANLLIDRELKFLR